MKKILFVSAAVLALSFASCKKDAPAQVESTPTTETPAEAPAETQAPAENGPLKELQVALDGVKAAAEVANADIPALFDQMKSIKESYESVKASFSAEEQSAFEAAANAVVELLKSKAQ